VAGLAAKLWAELPLETEDPAGAVRNTLHEISLDIDQPGEDNSSGFGFAMVPLIP